MGTSNITEKITQPSIAILCARVLLPFGVGYFLSYLYRTVNAVLGPVIAQDLVLDAAVMGLMTGVYFLAFGAFQIPLGLLLDRFGPRLVEAGLLIFAALGAFAFALADGAGMLIVGRALVGLGVSACLMAAIKANTLWFSPQKLPLVNGLILFSGGLGAIAATGPVQAALSITDWRGVYTLVAILTFATALLIFVTVPDRQVAGAKPEKMGQQLRQVGSIFMDRRFLKVMPIGAMCMGGAMAIQGLWAGPWLRDVAGLDPVGVGTGLTIMAVGIATGFLSMGIIAERLQRYGVRVIAVGGVGMAIWIVLVALMMIGWTGAPNFLLGAFGFFSAASSLMYVVVTGYFASSMAGRATTSLNLTMFLTAFVGQWGLGAIVGHFGQIGGQWSPEGYTWALAALVVPAILAYLWFLPALRRS